MAGSISTETSVDKALHQALKFHNERVSIINEDPGSRWFLLWFVISCYFPVITACLGPVANAISIACVVERWRYNRMEYVDAGINGIQALPVKIPDPKGIFAVNILSLIFGFVSNVVLIMHFTRKLSYLMSQLINITGWSCAGGMLLIDVIVCSLRDTPAGYHRTIGFWYACFTSGLYLGCAGTLTLHYIGFRLGKYPATFNLFTNERSIILFTVLMSLWLIWGAAMFCGLLQISYGNAMYFCTVSLLTVGFGDILPPNVAAKIMILIFSVSGVLLLGLIVFMTRSIITKSSGPIFYFHRLERTRREAWTKVSKGDIKLTNRQSFELMSMYKHRASFVEHMTSLLNTTIVFLMFWLLGAMVFHFAEGWSYFNCIYFCFLCLLTIGYGSDFAPSTGAGRAFFVVWAIGAVPLMGAILSTLGDVLADLTSKLDAGFAERFGYAVKYMIVQKVVNANRRRQFKQLFVTQQSVVDSETDAQDMSSTGPFNSDMDYATTADNSSVHSLDGIADSVKRISRRNSLRGSRSNSVTSENSLDPLEIVNMLTDKDISKTHDQLYYKLMDIQRQLVDLRKLHQISITDPSYKLSFQQWTNLRILNQHSLNEQNHSTELEESNFWLSDSTPLRFPLNESHYAFNRLFRHLDLQMERLLQDTRENIIATDFKNGQSEVWQFRRRSTSAATPRARAFSNPIEPIHWNEHLFQEHSSESMTTARQSTPTITSLSTTSNSSLDTGHISQPIPFPGNKQE